MATLVAVTSVDGSKIVTKDTSRIEELSQITLKSTLSSLACADCKSANQTHESVNAPTTALAEINGVDVAQTLEANRLPCDEDADCKTSAAPKCSTSILNWQKPVNDKFITKEKHTFDTCIPSTQCGYKVAEEYDSKTMERSYLCDEEREKHTK